jgi:Transglycosylase SLT domain
VRRVLLALAVAMAALGSARAEEPAGGPPPVAAPKAWDERQASECNAAIGTAEAEYDIPHGLLHSIAMVESGRPITSLGDVQPWPWTINADGDGYFLQSKAAAIAWMKLAFARGVRFTDVGCMQVNLQYHPQAFASLDEAFDPAANAAYGARFLRDLHDKAGGNWNVAVGWYHSQTPDLAQDYREKVAAVGAGIVRGIGGPEPLYQRALRRGTLRLALAHGGSIVLHIRQPSRSGNHETACQVAVMIGPLLSTPLRVNPCVSRRAG